MNGVVEIYWNHRVMRRQEHGEEILYIVECYYNEPDGSVLGWSEKEAVWAEDLDGLRQSLEWMTDALGKPILEEAELLRQAEEARDTEVADA